MDDFTLELLLALAYEGEVSLDAIAARTGIPLDTIEAALASDDLFDVGALGNHALSVRLTDYGYLLARGAIGDLAA